MQRLTEEQRRRWGTDGYLHLHGVLSAQEVAFFSEQLDRVRAQPGYEPSDLPRGHYGWLPHADKSANDGFMDRRDLLPYDQSFIDLIDRPNVFDLIPMRQP